MRIAVALSGGGFRASLFHLGVLRRIAELGWLPRVDAISTVSGGSIVGAFAALRWRRMLDAGGDAAAFQATIADPFVEVVSSRNVFTEWWTRLVVRGWPRIADPYFTRTIVFGELLSELFYDGVSCSELPDNPYTIFNATNLASARAFRFTKHGLGDSRIGYATWPSERALPVGVAVGASAAFPPVFAPLRLDAREYSFGGPVYPRDSPGEAADVIELTDGGVYENLGTEVVTKGTALPGGKIADAAEFLIVSDGGYPTRLDTRVTRKPLLSAWRLLNRVNDIALSQVAALRRRRLMEMFESKKIRGLLIVLGSDINRIASDSAYREVIGRNACPPAAVVRLLQRIRTHLNRFTRQEAECLMYYGYTLTDTVLWAGRDFLSRPYTRADGPPIWQMDFGPETIAEMTNALRSSHRVWR